MTSARLRRWGGNDPLREISPELISAPFSMSTYWPQVPHTPVTSWLNYRGNPGQVHDYYPNGAPSYWITQENLKSRRGKHLLCWALLGWAFLQQTAAKKLSPGPWACHWHASEVGQTLPPKLYRKGRGASVHNPQSHTQRSAGLVCRGAEFRVGVQLLFLPSRQP